MIELSLSLTIVAIVAGASVFSSGGAWWVTPLTMALVGLTVLLFRWLDRRQGREPTGFFFALAYLACIMWSVILFMPVLGPLLERLFD